MAQKADSARSSAVGSLMTARRSTPGESDMECDGVEGRRRFRGEALVRHPLA